MNNEYEITKREILFSIVIIAGMLLIGILISNKISEYQMDKNEIYNKAVKIKDSELFKYGMDTNVGNAFVYGELKSVDVVSYPEIVGNYMYIKKVKQRYTRHTRIETYITGSGKYKHTATRVVTYYTWDTVDREHKKCKEIMFCGVKFNSNKINLPEPNYIDTIKESHSIRYKYYGTKTKYNGTVFTTLKNHTISEDSDFYKDLNIKETVTKLEKNYSLLIFWIIWIVFICICVFVFYYLDNNWLEDKK